MIYSIEFILRFIQVVVEEILSSNDKEEEVKPEEKVEESSDNETSSQIGQLMAQRRAGGTDQNFFQAFLSLLQQGMRRKEVRQPLPPRPQGNVENFVVLLLGVTDEQNLLRSNVNFIQTFDDFQSLKNFLPKLTFEKTILIINESFVQSIEDYSSFNSVYILSKKSIQLEYPNIRGNYPDLKTISERIKNEFSIENDLILIESISASETDRSLFVYSQLLKETMLTKDNEGNLQKDFLDYCRLQYENNSVELKLIDQFEEDFTPMKSIWWFTRDCFVRKMIQRALRTQEVDILFKMRLIIQTINKQIKEKEFQRTVYRTMQLDLEQVKKIKDNDNGFLSFGTFLDCSLEKSTSMKYSEDKVTIQFMIQTNFGIEIEQIRHPNSTSEVLLPFDNIYQINGIEELNEHCAIIELIHIDQQDEKYQQLTNEMRSDIEGPVVIIQLGKLLLINDRYLHADYLARLLFDDQSFKDNPTLLASLAAVHHLLGSQDNKQNNHRAARLQFEQSLKIFLSFVPEDNQILSATYNNIGSMYYQDDEHDQAIIYHQKALQCQLKATSPDIEAIATYSGNIGAVYLDQKKYDEALFNYKRSLQILQQSIPGGESASIAMVYDRIASVYWRMERPDDALPYYQKALQMELKFLPENSHKISVSYFNLSTAYAKLNRLDEAIDAAEKSVQQLLKSVPPDHPEVKENTEQLEGLRRRKWLQQLYQ